MDMEDSQCDVTFKPPSQEFCNVHNPCPGDGEFCNLIKISPFFGSEKRRKKIYSTAWLTQVVEYQNVKWLGGFDSQMNER